MEGRKNQPGNGFTKDRLRHQPKHHWKENDANRQKQKTSQDPKKYF